MNTTTIPGGAYDPVESLVDKYMTDWCYSYGETEHEINHNFAMGSDDLQRALDYLRIKYKRKKVVKTSGPWEPGLPPDNS